MRHVFFSKAHATVALVLGSITTVLACESIDSDPIGPSDAGADVASSDAAVENLDADATPDDADADDDDVPAPDASVTCSVEPCVVAIAGAGGTFCALMQGGTVSCWGSNSQGQLGDDSFDGFSAHPRQVPSLESVTHVSLSTGNACARVANGAVHCWGARDLVRAGSSTFDAGDNPYEPVRHPTHEELVSDSASVSVGVGFACVTTATGTVSCWGSNGSLALGRGATADSLAPPELVTLRTTTAKAIVAGSGRAFAITTGGDVVSWGGSTQYGSVPWGSGTQYAGHVFLLGRDTSEDPDGVPSLIPGLRHVRAVATGSIHSCAVIGRDVTCWGANDQGQLGRGTYDPFDYLPEPSNLRFVANDASDANDAGDQDDVPSKVAIGDGHTCAVMGSGRIYCWGNTMNAGLLGPTLDAQHAPLTGVPTRIDGLGGPAASIATGDDAACALLRSGAVECWGSNVAGQLGIGAADGSPHPLPARVTFSN